MLLLSICAWGTVTWAQDFDSRRSILSDSYLRDYMDKTDQVSTEMLLLRTNPKTSLLYISFYDLKLAYFQLFSLYDKSSRYLVFIIKLHKRLKVVDPILGPI